MSDVTGTEDNDLRAEEAETPDEDLNPRQRVNRNRRRQLKRLSDRMGVPVRALASKSGGMVTNGQLDLEDIADAVEKLNPRNAPQQQKAGDILRALAVAHIQAFDPEMYEDLADDLKGIGEPEDLAKGTWVALRGSNKPHIVFEDTVLGDVHKYVAREKRNGDWEYEELDYSKIRGVCEETPEHGPLPEGMDV